MLHEMGEVGYGLKSLLLLQSSLPALRTMLPTSQPQQDPLPRVVLAGTWAVSDPGCFSQCRSQPSPSVRERAGAPTAGDVTSTLS